jgi:SAM-dependent methyltransferase
MLKMADVRADDVVFDLGCGDGRIVIEAARQRGARGVGIDLDPRRIKESVESTERMGLADSVRFINEDLFRSDIHEATVVMLFLFPDVNMRLRPKLLRDLTPGTRVVSYCHNMDRWIPDRSMRMRTNYIYYWVVPENMSGKWEGAAESDGRTTPVTLVLGQQFQRLSGAIVVGDEALRVEDGVVKGQVVSIMAREDIKGSRLDVLLDGLVHGDNLNGVARIYGTPAFGRTWTARRDPSTRIDIADS